MCVKNFFGKTYAPRRGAVTYLVFEVAYIVLLICKSSLYIDMNVRVCAADWSEDVRVGGLHVYDQSRSEVLSFGGRSEMCYHGVNSSEEVYMCATTAGVTE